jgi:hypothetical protein
MAKILIQIAINIKIKPVKTRWRSRFFGKLKIRPGQGRNVPKKYT